MRIDHVIYGTSDLDPAARRVEEGVGVAAVAGGHHESLGTHNQIVPLSDGTSIELLAIADPEEASPSPVGTALHTAVIERPADPDTEVPRSGAVRITWIEVAGNAWRLEEWLGDAELPAPIVSGDPAIRAVGVGERELRAP